MSKRKLTLTNEERIQKELEGTPFRMITDPEELAEYTKIDPRFSGESDDDDDEYEEEFEEDEE